MANRYQLAKQQKKCPQCGCDMTGQDRVTCEDCIKRQSKQKAKNIMYYRKMGKCPYCKVNYIYGDEGYCPECRVMRTEWSTKSRNIHREEYNEKHRKYSKEKYDERKKLGICTRCGKRNVTDRFTTCAICRDKIQRNKKPKEHKITGRTVTGLCFFCSEPAKDGYKVCEKHYQMNIEKANSEKSIENRKKITEKENQRWVKTKKKA